MKRYLGLAVAVLALVAATPSRGQELKINWCTGGEQGNYYWSATEIAKFLPKTAGGKSIGLTIYTTKGSAENMDRLSAGQCNLATAQNDAAFVHRRKNPSARLSIEPLFKLYTEVAHVLCNRKAGVTALDDMDPKKGHKLAVGPAGSGMFVTWDSFMIARKDYERIPLSTLTGQRAVEAVRSGDDVTCMMYVAGLNTQFLKDVASSGAGKDIRLIGVSDSRVRKTPDDKGKPLYEDVTIPGGTYNARGKPDLQDGTFGSGVDTLGVPAVVFMSADLLGTNEGEAFANALISAKNKANGAIQARVNPR